MVDNTQDEDFEAVAHGTIVEVSQGCAKGQSEALIKISVAGKMVVLKARVVNEYHDNHDQNIAVVKVAVIDSVTGAKDDRAMVGDPLVWHMNRKVREILGDPRDAVVVKADPCLTRN